MKYQQKYHEKYQQKYQPYHPQKNDVWFGFVMAVMFAMTIVADAAGAFSVARGHVAAEVAGTRQTPRAEGDAPLIARAGAEK
jgi:hypothetical protein